MGGAYYEIRELLLTDRSDSEIAALVGCTRQNVNQIRHSANFAAYKKARAATELPFPLVLDIDGKRIVITHRDRKFAAARVIWGARVDAWLYQKAANRALEPTVSSTAEAVPTAGADAESRK